MVAGGHGPLHRRSLCIMPRKLMTADGFSDPATCVIGQTVTIPARRKRTAGRACPNCWPLQVSGRRLRQHGFMLERWRASTSARRPLRWTRTRPAGQGRSSTAQRDREQHATEVTNSTQSYPDLLSRSSRAASPTRRSTVKMLTFPPLRMGKTYVTSIQTDALQQPGRTWQ